MKQEILSKQTGPLLAAYYRTPRCIQRYPASPLRCIATKPYKAIDSGGGGDRHASDRPQSYRVKGLAWNCLLAVKSPHIRELVVWNLLLGKQRS